MRFFKKIQKLNVFWKKVIVFLVIIALGIPFGFLVGKNFQKRAKEFNQEEFLEKLKVSEVKEEMKSVPLDELKEKMEEINKTLEELEKLTKQTATSSTSTE